ncbi:Dammarenediol II synthase [Camellia lanceoleosa]|uniref:Dammarenediol II synthase n=1 Tax=Camellia lanceoleosa TaxID=1840588 RepID=A0ACC0GJK8_9ERIC|nr:Dammarenediol II synthase [Camellia lanceoleosa]
MIGSALDYVALHLLGEGPDDGEEGAMTTARQWILDNGIATGIRSWGKTYLPSLQTMCWWVENPDGDEFKHHLARVLDYLWLVEDGMKMQSFGSQIWDTTLATQAIIVSNMADEYGDSLKKAHVYIKESQIKKNPVGDFKSMYRYFTKGAWTFSDQDQGWVVLDCIAESLKMLNPPELFAVNVVETEHVECTAFIIHALLTFKRLHPMHQQKEIEISVAKAIGFLERIQWPNGSW